MPDQSVALTGCVMVSREEFGDQKRHFRLTTDRKKSVVYTAVASPKIDPRQIGLSGTQRELLGLSENDDVELEAFTPDRASTVTMVKFEIDFYQKTNIKKQFDADAMVKDIQSKFAGYILAVGHSLPYKHEQSPFFLIKVKGNETAPWEGVRIYHDSLPNLFRAKMHENAKWTKVNAE